MRKSFLLLFVLLMMPAAAWSQAAGYASETGVAKEVFATIAKWGEAVRARNTKSLGEIFEENAVITTYEGKTRGKKEELELLKPRPDFRGISVKNEDIKVRVFGNAAVATAECRMAYVSGERLMNVAFRYTASFAKEDGRWQIVALHTSRPSQ